MDPGPLKSAPGVPLAEPVPLTNQQRRAIDARDVSVALSAGAGCGKTFVLTERFLSHLEPGRSDSARLGQLLAITFTERAAREMRDRIREKCRSRLLECPEKEARYWLDLLRELDTARISTIHSFCASLLRSHAVEAGLDPRFRVLDQAQADTLLNEMIDDQLRERLAKQEAPVMDLIVQFGLRRLGAMIEQLLRRRQEIDWDKWAGVDARLLAAKWGEYHRCKALPLLLHQIVASDEAKTVLDIAGRNPSANPEMKTRMAFLLETLPGLGESADPPAALAKIREAAKIQAPVRRKTGRTAICMEITARRRRTCGASSILLKGE